MTDENVTHLPPPIRNTSRRVLTEPGVDWMAGPFPSEFKVVIDGKVVPHLCAYAYDDGKFTLHLDNRLGYDFSNEADAQQAVCAIADALAIGAGHPSFRAADRWPFGANMTKLDKVPR